MKTITKITLLLLLIQSIYAQEKGARTYSYVINEIGFYKYQQGFIVKATKDFKAIKNEFPEDLMQSVLSCSNEEWEIFNTLGGKEKAEINDSDYYNHIQKMNVEKTYFELKHKLEFEIDGVPTAIVKFYFITENSPKPQAGLTVMQKKGNRWYKTSMKMVSNLAMTVLRLKTEEFEKIINGTVNTPELIQINKKVFVNGKLDFNKLNQEIDLWYMEPTKENISKKTYFKDPYSIL